MDKHDADMMVLADRLAEYDAAVGLFEAAKRALVMMDMLRAETGKLRYGSECSIGHYAEFHTENLQDAIARWRAVQS